MKDLVTKKEVVKKATSKVTTPKTEKANRYVGTTLRGSILRAYWVAVLSVTGQVVIAKDKVKASTKKPSDTQVKLGIKLLDSRRNHVPKGNVTDKGAITEKGILYINSDTNFDMDTVKKFVKGITSPKAGTDYMQVQV